MIMIFSLGLTHVCPVYTLFVVLSLSHSGKMTAHALLFWRMSSRGVWRAHGPRKERFFFLEVFSELLSHQWVEGSCFIVQKNIVISTGTTREKLWTTSSF